MVVLSAEEELHQGKVCELDDGFVGNCDRGKRVGLDPILKSAEESNAMFTVSTNRAASLS